LNLLTAMAPADGKNQRSRTRQRAVRGVGLTPRIFDALVKTSVKPIEALPSAYVPAIKQHVTPRFMAIVYCPVVVEFESGVRRVLYIDPLDVRDFRCEVREELKQVQDKRQRCLKRIHQIRDHLPRVHPHLAQERLQREVQSAKEHAVEPLIQGLPSGVSHLWVFLEVSSHMVQLELICQQLTKELPGALEGCGACMLTLVAVGLPEPEKKKGALNSGRPKDFPQSLELRDALSEDGREALEAWLERLVGIVMPETPTTEEVQSRGARGAILELKGGRSSRSSSRGSKNAPSRAKGRKVHASGSSKRFELAEDLGRSVTADALVRGRTASDRVAALLIACSAPSDAEECEALLRRSRMELIIAGVLGGSPEDPEPTYESFVNAAAQGSKLYLWFGPDYWQKFAEARQRQLDFMHAFNPSLKHERPSGDTTKLSGEVISSEMLEMRLLERVMRECYVDEQRCEEELTCLNKVLAKSLLDEDEIKEALKPTKDTEDDNFLDMANLIFHD